jgi:ribosomal protein S19
MAAVREGAQCLPCFITNRTIGYNIGSNNATKPMQQAMEQGKRRTKNQNRKTVI